MFRAFPFVGRFFKVSLRAEEAVARVAEAGDDVAVLVEAAVESGDEYLHIRVRFRHGFDAGGSGDDAHEHDLFAAAVLEEAYRRGRAAAGCEHGIEQDSHAVLDAVGELAVVFVRLQRFLVAVESDVSHFGGGEEGVHAVHHAESRAENGHDRDGVVRHHGLLGEFEGSLHHDLFGGYVLEALVHHEGGDLLHQFAELFHARVDVAEDRDLMTDERMVEYGHVGVVFHFSSSVFSVLSAAFSSAASSPVRMSSSSAGTSSSGWLSLGSTEASTAADGTLASSSP